MNYLTKELKNIFMALISMLMFYLQPLWLVNNFKQSPNAIEQAMLLVKKSIALMVIIITALSLIFTGFEFVQENEKPGEIFAVLLVHGAMVTVLIAIIAWIFLRHRDHVGNIIGWFIIAFWVPMWVWNMIFEIYVGAKGLESSNLFLQLAHDEDMLDWHFYVLSAIWLHATFIAILGLIHILNIKTKLIILIGLLSSSLYFSSFLFLHKTQKGVEIIYLIFGMG